MAAQPGQSDRDDLVDTAAWEAYEEGFRAGRAPNARTVRERFELWWRSPLTPRSHLERRELGAEPADDEPTIRPGVSEFRLSVAAAVDNERQVIEESLIAWKVASHTLTAARSSASASREKPGLQDGD